ncbi:F-box domain-containing protein [Mycena chlorophos]|uniref:F-box domain-containing protein n=1 Tax=Mycena chlorophos TaxID=658473 RepID=A0A8H6TLT1_MYCCL|nr:F-box domain-containing protein [Mycena chlorophos]
MFRYPLASIRPLPHVNPDPGRRRVPDDPKEHHIRLTALAVKFREPPFPKYYTALLLPTNADMHVAPVPLDDHTTRYRTLDDLRTHTWIRPHFPASLLQSPGRHSGGVTFANPIARTFTVTGTVGTHDMVALFESVDVATDWPVPDENRDAFINAAARMDFRIIPLLDEAGNAVLGAERIQLLENLPGATVRVELSVVHRPIGSVNSFNGLIKNIQIIHRSGMQPGFSVPATVTQATVPSPVTAPQTVPVPNAKQFVVWHCSPNTPVLHSGNASAPASSVAAITSPNTAAAAHVVPAPSVNAAGPGPLPDTGTSAGTTSGGGSTVGPQRFTGTANVTTNGTSTLVAASAGAPPQPDVAPALNYAVPSSVFNGGSTVGPHRFTGTANVTANGASSLVPSSTVALPQPEAAPAPNYAVPSTVFGSPMPAPITPVRSLAKTPVGFRHSTHGRGRPTDVMWTPSEPLSPTPGLGWNIEGGGTALPPLLTFMSQTDPVSRPDSRADFSRAYPVGLASPFIRSNTAHSSFVHDRSTSPQSWGGSNYSGYSFVNMDAPPSDDTSLPNRPISEKAYGKRRANDDVEEGPSKTRRRD